VLKLSLYFSSTKISFYFACVIALYFYVVLFCFDVYGMFDLFLDVA